MKRTTSDASLSPEQFTRALDALGWKQTDFARRTGLSLSAVNRWATGQAPAPLWAAAYLGAMLDLASLHAKYLAPLPAPGADEPGDAESPAPARLAHVLASKPTGTP
ncbi:MAG: helix-turn-helix transcriptional regulator [Burkholderiales bacterium]|nr:helix-turn-helix transcriptional regulator [Burkholderiales bacterium]